MGLYAMLIIVFCSVGILLCLTYIMYQLQKEKMEKYAAGKIAERERENEQKRLEKRTEKRAKRVDKKNRVG